MPWTCHACTYLNTKMTRTKCEVCQTPRDVDLEDAMTTQETPEIDHEPSVYKQPIVQKKPKDESEPIIGITPFSKELEGGWEDDQQDDEDAMEVEDDSSSSSSTSSASSTSMVTDSSTSTTSSTGSTSTKETPVKEKKISLDEKSSKKKKPQDDDEDLWGSDADEPALPIVKENDRSAQRVTESPEVEKEEIEYEVLTKREVDKTQQKQIDNAVDTINTGKFEDESAEKDLDSEWGGLGEEALSPKVVQPKSTPSVSLKPAEPLSRDDIILLLRGNSWDSNKLIDSWKSDPRKCQVESGVLSEDEPTKKTKGTKPPKEIDCLLCGDTEKFDNTFALQCNHRFCNNCWKSWITAEHEKGPRSLLMCCPSFKCKLIIPLSVQLRFLKKKEATSLLEWDMDSYVQACPSLAWCPAPKCTRAVHRLTPFVRGVVCVCGSKWCFDCRNEDHNPCGCLEAKTWLERIKKEGGSAEYILANTKACPKCKVNIEKNQGCNHMTCSQCRHEFCWLCFGDWRGHTACNTYKKDGKKGKGEPTEGVEGKDDSKLSAEELRRNLERWVFYHDRFLAHKNSVAFAQKTLAQAYDKAARLKELKNSNFKACEFLIEAAKEIIVCRKILSWSYVYAYYVAAKDTNIQRRLFESHQERLEKFTDNLHEMIEKPLDMLMETHFSQQIAKATSVTSKYRRNVIKNCIQSPLPSVLSTDNTKDKAVLDPKNYVAAKRKALFALLPKAKDKVKNSFTCAACTFINKGGSKCELCGTPRPY